MKSMRLLQLNKSSDSIDEEEEEETEFRDVTLHLYRQTVPDFEERKKFLEQKLIVRAENFKFSADMFLTAVSLSNKDLCVLRRSIT